ncbi:MAG: ATP-binding protein [Tepidibacillus sp.]
MRLQTKLIIAFSSIVIVMALLQSLYFQNRIGTVFENYVSQNESTRIQVLKEMLLNYYDYYQSWDQIQEQLVDNPFQYRARRGPMWANSQNSIGMENLEIIVANQQGIVVGDTQNKWLGKSAKEISGIHEDLILNENKVGELIINRDKSNGLTTLEQQFMNSMNTSILFGTSIAVVIAVLLGLFFSKTMTKPLSLLMTGIHYLSKGDTSYRIQVKTEDEFHQLANAFNEMSAKLERNEEVRKNLVADVAHELRTPLSILRGKLESIQEDALEPSPEVIVQLNDEVFRLSRLVNDLQQLTLAEAGKLPLNKSETNLNELIQRVIDHFEWLAEEKQIDLVFKKGLNPLIEIDADRITQVIINLLGNALRHTPEHGKVLVEIRPHSYNSNLVIKVMDSGPGIDEEFLPYIFERFYRTDASRSRDQGGTGLGLAIAKGFIEAHGGKISVESKKGKGTTFFIELPRGNHY